MTRKDEPQLVTTGPYRLVRHPIYSGILLAGIGTAAALSWMRLSVVAVAAIYFGSSATVEERLLDDALPGTYRAYQHSTNRLVPFIF